MNEAQLGLVISTPAILAFIVFMYRKGAMNLPGAFASAFMSVAIATMLFLSQ